jgi:NitT/TauT family transport system ATP-binding protein
MATPKLGVERAGKTHRTTSGSVVALAGFSLDVAAGEFVSIVGPSGCGKSTLLWAMAGLHGLDQGRVLLDGQPVTGPHPQIAMVFQEANLLPWQNLRRNIELPMRLRRSDPGSTRARIARLLARVGLDGFEGKFPRELSGGMQQRASIVRALSVDPQVLLMDEPFGALDSFTREDMNLLVEEIWMETRKTVVFVTHSIPEAVFLSDRVVVMSARPGRLSAIFDIDLPRPRPLSLLEEPQFGATVAQVKASIDRGRPAKEGVAAWTQS